MTIPLLIVCYNPQYCRQDDIAVMVQDMSQNFPTTVILITTHMDRNALPFYVVNPTAPVMLNYNKAEK